MTLAAMGAVGLSCWSFDQEPKVPGTPLPQSDWLAALAANPEIYPQVYRPDTERVLLIRMGEEEYRAASFLDGRNLRPDTEGAWFPFGGIERAVAEQQPAALHFIFHAGHVGSTLLSRLLEEVADVLSLREPLPLRALADLYDISDSDCTRPLNVFLKLWSRRFRPGQMAVLKATSTAGRMAPALLSAAPQARAIYLNLAPEPYLLTLLAGANSAADLQGHKAVRLRQLQIHLGEMPDISSPGELAAMSWLAERLSQHRTTEAAGKRVLNLDFDELLSGTEAVLHKAAAHLQLTPVKARLGAIGQSPVLFRYSKAPQYDYSPALRTQVLAEARKNHAHELKRGLAWIDNVVKASRAAANLL